MTALRPAVLIVGGSGAFGAHVCRRLARLKLWRMVVGGRQVANAAALIRELAALDPGCAPEFVVIDRNKPTADHIRKLGVSALVDAAGPFQHSSHALVEAAIATGVHYIDLCDARAFAKGIGAFDSAAKLAGVAVLTGASSTPAISNALLRDLVEGWQSIDRISVAILPGNKAPRGRSVMEAILSWVGEPVRVFDEGRWQEKLGWSGSRKVSLGTLGWRNAALAETPDLDIMVEDFTPRISARFHAGLELGVMHHGLRLAGLLRSWRLLPRLDWLIDWFHLFAQPLARFGTDAGGMVVEAEGIDAQGHSVRGTARLVARDGHGPMIPALASVALLKQIADGSLSFRGADHAGRHVETSEIMALVADLSIKLESELQMRRAALFRIVLGDLEFDQMPTATKSVHRGAPAVLIAGLADIEPADTIGGRMISALFRFPRPGRQVPLEVLIEQTDKSERWVRRYPGREMVSVMGSPDANGNTLEETFGIFSFCMKISARRDGLDMQMISARAGPVPLPGYLVPEVTATERVDKLGRHMFDVSISLPIIGRIVRYSGWLAEA